MIPISTVVVGSGGSTTIDFINIPQSYTDLLLNVSLRSTNASATASEYYGVYFNSSTSNLSYRRLYAVGSGAGSDNGSIVLVATMTSAGFTSSTFANGSIYIPNYNSSNNKSFSTNSVAENNSSTEFEIDLTASLWSNTSPITNIQISPRRDSFAQYSTATLYGIRKY
jgi:hypothetical protein